MNIEWRIHLIHSNKWFGPKVYLEKKCIMHITHIYIHNPYELFFVLDIFINLKRNALIRTNNTSIRLQTSPLNEYNNLPSILVFKTINI